MLLKFDLRVLVVKNEKSTKIVHWTLAGDDTADVMLPFHRI